MIKIIKKDGTLEDYNIQKVITAITKSANRVLVNFTDEELDKIHDFVDTKVRESNKDIPIIEMHSIVEAALDSVNPRVAKSYRDYRNYKQEFVHMLDDVYKKSQAIMYIGDKENSNTDSALVSTKRSLIFNQLNKELYQKFFMTVEELQACREGYIYVHDMSARRDTTMNCCLFNVKEVLTGGFEMGNIWYNEPNSLDTAFDVIGDIVMSAASQQYGGFTLPEIDKLLEPYAVKSYDKYIKEFKSIAESLNTFPDPETIDVEADKYAMKKVRREFDQGFQGWEYKFNTVASSRGDYPFITVTSGLGTSEFCKMCNISMLNVRKGGQGKEWCKKAVLFPKIVFLYDKDLHGPGCELEDVFEAGIECSMKTMYPDWLSLSGDDYVSSIYKKYKKVISPMGCVDGEEVVTYKFHDKLYVESIKKMWDRITDEYEPKVQIEGEPHLYVDTKNLKIYDHRNGFVKVTRMVRNVSDDWAHIKLTNGRSLTCTTDHPLPVIDRGRTYVKDINVGDKIPIIKKPYDEVSDSEDNEDVGIVTSIDFYNDTKYSYDVTTESDHFDVSGIYSHNCRAFLSPWYERGGMNPADENDEPIYVGRFNIGAISLHLPMIYAKSLKENKDFYEVLDYYLELIRNLHLRTYDYLGEMKASTNPLAYCEGGFYGGHLGLHDKIKPLLKSATASFGITALNELQELYNKKSLVEDGVFALEVMEYINKKITEFKEEDGVLYAIYGKHTCRIKTI